MPDSVCCCLLCQPCHAIFTTLPARCLVGFSANIIVCRLFTSFSIRRLLHTAALLATGVILHCHISWFAHTAGFSGHGVAVTNTLSVSFRSRYQLPSLRHNGFQVTIR